MSLSINFLTTEQAESIQKRQRIVNKGILYTVGAAVATLAAESVYRNLGGDPGTPNYMFQAGGYALLASGIVAYFNNQEKVVSLNTPKADSLESKVSA